MDKSILVVEDEPDIREAISEQLTEAGFTVHQAENGEVGLAKALEFEPDLILLDIKMPIMNGQEVLAKLRQDPWGQSAKIIMLTSMDDTRNIATAHQGFIADYIIKAHHSLDEILAKVREALYTDS